MDGLRAYAFVSIFVAHAADGTISDEEIHVIQRNIHRAAKALGFGAQRTDALARATLDDYQRLVAAVGPGDLLGRFRREIQTLCDLYGADPFVLQAIQRDLRDLAAADGDVADMESYLIAHVGETWWRLRRN